jgi:hypothetical protein
VVKSPPIANLQTVSTNSMTTTMAKSQRPIKQGVLAFFSTLLILLTLLTGHYLFHYKDDIFGKAIDNIDILKITGFGLLSFVKIAFPISILVMTTVYYRQRSINGQVEIAFKKTLLTSSAALLVCFIWTAFLSPLNNVHMMGLLYDIKRAGQNEKMERTELGTFEDSPLSQNYCKLGRTIDNSLMTKEQVTRLQIERCKMIGFPLMSFILFYSGVFLGILNQKSRLFFLLLGFYLAVIPSIYYLQLYFESLVRQTTLSPLQGQFYYLSILTALTVGIFLIVKQQRG